MPTYQYACTSTDCGNEFELVQSFTDPSASECPTCGGPVRKVFSAVGVVFKGSGFYRTDSRKSGAATDGAARSEKSSDKSGEKAADKSAAKSGDKAASSSSSSDSGSSSASKSTASSSAKAAASA
jgi:putative FmdB family regulatory protein